MTLRTLERPTDTATLYRRAATGALFGRLPGFSGGSRPSVLPDLELALEDIELDREHLAAYDRVCGFGVRDELPATYLHNVAFPLAMELMTDDQFPFPVIGMVHVENRIEQRRVVRVDERPSIRLRAENLRPHRAGRQLDVVAEAAIDGEVVWVDTSTYLRRGAGGSGGGSGVGKGRPPAPEPEAVFTLPADLGRRFGAVSGDRNPIHMSALSAKAFGMPAAIAHGMWLKARCLAALEATLPDAFTVDVAFKRPVVLPARVGFSTSEIDGRLMFALHDRRTGAPHLEGSITPG
jgi:hypothetical protein